MFKAPAVRTAMIACFYFNLYFSVFFEAGINLTSYFIKCQSFVKRRKFSIDNILSKIRKLIIVGSDNSNIFGLSCFYRIFKCVALSKLINQPLVLRIYGHSKELCKKISHRPSSAESQVSDFRAPF